MNVTLPCQHDGHGAILKADQRAAVDEALPRPMPLLQEDGIVANLVVAHQQRGRAAPFLIGDIGHIKLVSELLQRDSVLLGTLYKAVLLISRIEWRAIPGERYVVGKGVAP